MGLPSDIRSGKPDGLGRAGLMCWVCAGSIAGRGLAVDFLGHWKRTLLAFVLAGAMNLPCVEFAGAFGEEDAAGVAVLAGLPLAATAMLIGVS